MTAIVTRIDPFGNYLCQKLLEYSNDDQRTVLINNAASQMVKIALNQHGTRALQKMIEFISTPEQVRASESISWGRQILIHFEGSNDHLCPERSSCGFDPGSQW